MITPACRSLAAPASATAEFGQIARPWRFASANASRSSGSVTLSTTPSKKRISRSAFGCDTGAPMRIADAAVSPATSVTRSLKSFRYDW